jgi:hypothetical protein
MRSLYKAVPHRRYAAGRCSIVAGITALLTFVLNGCTLYSAQKSPTLVQTTSAEQVDRIFWENVQQAKWTQANALLAPNTVWRIDGQIVPRGEIVPWLQSIGIHGVQVSDVTITPAVNDMNLVYTVQVQAEKAVAAKVNTGCSGHPQTLHALAVWQQPQPTGKPEKDKQYRGYLLTVHDLYTSSDESCR